MKFIPILYTTPMVQAILDDRKTKTRRTNGLEFVNEFPDNYKWLNQYEQMDIPRPARKYDDRFYYAFTWKNDNSVLTVLHCPYGKPGDILWVRESFVNAYFNDGKNAYKADWNKVAAAYVSEPKWKPSIHMPKLACRLFLKVKSLRVERLHDISEDDAIAEGIEIIPMEGYNSKNPPDPKFMGIKYDYPKSYKGQRNIRLVPIESFKSLWASINGIDSLKSNPFVWVIEFERYTPTSQELDIFYKQN